MRKCFSCWQQNDDEEGEPIPNTPNTRENEGAFNVCGLIDARACETWTFGLGLNGEGPNCPRRENWHAKQRAFYDGNCEHNIMKALTVSFLNGMSTMIDTFSARPHDVNVLTW